MDGSSGQGTPHTSYAGHNQLQGFHLLTHPFSQVKREQVVTTIGELIEAKTEVANIVVDVLSSECFVVFLTF